MRIFVTGATGFVGSALVPELVGAGHRVIGLARSEPGAEALRAAGAEPLRGAIEDLDGLRAGAARADGVIHLAFNDDYARNDESVANERRAIAALADALAGSSRPLVVTSATAMAASVGGAPSTEESSVAGSFNPRAGVEALVKERVDRGANVSIVRLSQIHDTRKQGFVQYLLAWARQKGASAYVGDGENRWAAAHVADTARLYRLVIERAVPAVYHAVDEEGVSLEAIAEALARGLGVPAVSVAPTEAEAWFGWLAPFAALDAPSSSAITRRTLGWTPTGPTLIADLDGMDDGA